MTEHPTSREAGFTLPLALFGILGLTALALAAFALVLGEVGDGTVEARVVADLAAAGRAPTVEDTGSWSWTPGAGYRAEVVPAGHGRRVRLRVVWVPDPRRDALEWGEPAQQREAVLGPLSASDLVGVAARGVEEGHAVPVPPGALLPGVGSGDGSDGSVQVWGDGVLWVPAEGVADGAGTGLLVAPGELRLTGSGILRGLVAAGGWLEVDGAVAIRGGAAGGLGVRLLGEGAVEVDLPALEAALSHPLLAREVVVSGGAHLGWYAP